MARIINGDCLDVMASMDPESVDAIVTDPPYGLEFMGKEWDRFRIDDTGTRRNRGDRAASLTITKVNADEPRPPDDPWQKEASGYRAGDRAMTYRCVGCGKRDQWRNEHGCVSEWKREVVDPHAAPPMALAYSEWTRGWALAALRVAKPGAYLLAFGGTRTFHRLACAIEDAGWIIRDTLVWAYASGFPKSRANLKPAWEPIVMARKPGPLRDLDIEGCRIGENPGYRYNADRNGTTFHGEQNARIAQTAEKRGSDVIESSAGRWPANVILTDPIFDGGWDGVVGGGEVAAATSFSRKGTGIFDFGDQPLQPGYGDTGTYSRFFLIPKASRSDREPLVAGELEQKSGRPLGISQWEGQTNGSGKTMGPSGPRTNTHPTVKPVELMRHLVRLVTPQGGVVLDPFLGSGSTGVAAEQEGFDWIGIEREAEYVAIAKQRMVDVQSGLGLDVPAPVTPWKDYPTAVRYPVKGPSQSSWFTESTRDDDA